VPRAPVFLSLDEILIIHQQQLALYGGGGGGGIRDIGLLESALAMPFQSFGGAYVHDGLFEQAAAYLFHLCKNHPFVDGNKRVALAAALVFLALNGVRIVAHEDELTELVVSVAAGRTRKAAIAVFLLEHGVKRPKKR
jgi:death on curing protein